MAAPLPTDFDAFLLAPIGEDVNGLPLTLLSLLARLDVDPWEEAASLALLPPESAALRLTSLLATPAGGPVPQADPSTIATRLVTLLHRAPKPRVPIATAPVSLASSFLSKGGIKPAIYWLIAVILLLLCQWALAGAPPVLPGS
jgi:hypothetical protein